MTSPPVYTDEDFPLPVAKALRERGFTVVTAVEQGNLGLTDEEQAGFAARRGYVLVSHNRRDFERVTDALEQRGTTLAVLLLPQDINRHRLTLRTAMLLDWRSTLPEPQPPVLVWNDLQQELLRGLRLTEYSEDDVRLVLGWKPRVTLSDQ